MEKTIRVVMIDDNEAVSSSVKKYFWSNAVINIVGTFNNGRDGLNYLIQNRDSYDMIILDILLPHIDGIRILDELKTRGINKKVIVLSSYKDEYTIRQVQALNANYFMLKPFSVESLEKRIIDINSEKTLIQTLNRQSLEVEVSSLLHGLGIPSHVRGYQYIREGIMLIYENSSALTLITKEIYPEIAMKFDTTSSRVERAIRHAIEISWIRGDLKIMEELFGHSIDFERAKPTNSEFLTTIADHLKMNNKVLVS